MNSMPEPIALSASISKVVSFAMHQASVPVVGELRLRNESEESIDGVSVVLSCDPPVIAERRWTFDRIRADSEVVPSDLTVSLNGGMLYRLTERMRVTVTIRAMRGEERIAEIVNEVIALSRHEWGGSISTPELLAAFVTPNDPGVTTLLAEASDRLRESGRPPSLDGYQSQSRERVWDVAAAIWNVVAARQLIYAEPPTSFERFGQKIRLPSEILGSRLATCLDSAVLFAAALEQAGLRPLICLTRGHALTALWLQPSTLLGATTEDASDLRTYVKLKELIVFETTSITHEPPATFSQAIELGNQRIRAELESEFVLALDIRQARARQILPLPAEVANVEGAQTHKVFALPLEHAPSLPNFTPAPGQTISDTPEGRLDAWKRRLLDLTKRNRLLNLKSSKTAIRLICSDVAKLEDMLAGGGKITIVAMESLSGRGGDRDDGHLRVQRKVDFEIELARQALEENRVPAQLADLELKAGIVELFRKAKSDMEEGGANTLFLAIGMLRWRDSETSSARHEAPLLLVPVKLERATAASPPRLVQHTDETVFNMTLLEMLRQDFELRIPQLERELPKDGHGVDVGLVLTTVRKAIRDVPGWEVLDSIVLSTFSFAKYLMWTDLKDHTDVLRDTPFVRHMIDSPRQLYTRAPSFIQAREQDERIDPSQLLTPLPCDSSQVAAIFASGEEGDFVLEGPPGTGKSQTIANLIAHNLGHGRTVLFVAEKMTALNVVHDRLKSVGLGDFCLELHSSKANKKDVLAQLDRAWTVRGEIPTDSWEVESARLASVRSSLNGLVRALHTPGDTGISPRGAIARAMSSAFAPSVQLDWDAELSADRAKDRGGLERLTSLARELGQTFGQTSSEDAVAFGPLRQSDWSYRWQVDLSSAAATLRSSIDEAQTAASQFLELTRISGSVDTIAELRRVADFAGSIPLAARMNLQSLLAPDGTEVAERLRRAAAMLAQYRESVSTLSVQCDPTTIVSSAVEGIKRAWQEAGVKWWPFSAFARRKTQRDAMQRFDATERMDLAADLKKLESLATLRADMDRCAEGLPTSALWRGLETDVEQIELLVQLGEAARMATTKLARQPGEIPDLRQRVRTLFVDGRELLQPGMPVAVAAEALQVATSRLLDSTSVFGQLASQDGSTDHTPLVELRAFATAVIDRAPRLKTWCQWQERRGQAVGQGLVGLVAGLEAGLIRPDETVEAFEVSYARWLAPLLIDSRVELRKFSAVSQAHLLATFRSLDVKLAALAGESVRARIGAEIPPKSAVDVVPGFGVLRREVQRRTGHSPVRRLVSDMGAALTRLTPCLLMSPHSVAQYLATSQTKFDLVVFDEASQIAVWDAIGAIARGRNVIIVGDPKQMPPTNFFGRSADLDDTTESDVTATNVGDLESILDEGLAAGMHHHRLTGHYRSQHESLIAFSNHKYYGGDLVTYPAAVTQASAVSFRRCNGAYQKGKGRTNPDEAKAVVKEIVERLSDSTRSHHTIGVVTMNSEQQRLIRDLLDDARRQRPELERGFRDSSGEEVEMVYNLETVQGHERDVIMLSVGYGPTVAGDRTMSMNFGPLNRVGGERRLNVAITRAIREVVVFASFDPEMIDCTRTSSRAVHDLKAYLDFANRGPVSLARQPSFSGGTDEFESPFEEHVAGLLRAKGWTIQTQVGVSKFRIDLGVVHPDHPGRFLAGVECDGATFHSSSTARDRDRVRHSVLTSLGWQLVRLWSTDFFLEPEASIGRVHAALTGMLELDREITAKKVASAVSTHAVAAVDGTEPGPEVMEAEGQKHPDPQSDAIGGEADGKCVSDAMASPMPATSPTVPAAVVDSMSVSVHNVAGDQTHVSAIHGSNSSLPWDGARFYEDAYLETLRALALDLIDRLGPMTDAHLSERIARAHGFLRTGSEIKKRVSLAVDGQRRFTSMPDRGVTYWPKHLKPTAHMPFRGAAVAGEDRPWQFTPYVEKLGLAVDIVSTCEPSSRIEEMARRIGLGRLRSARREELVGLIEEAAAMLDAK